MRLRHYLLLGTFAAATAACSSKHPTGEATPEVVTSDAMSSDAMSTAAPVADAPDTANMAPQAFADAASASDTFEIMSSREALKRSTNVAVKTYAQMMIKDHTKSTADLKAAAAKLLPKVEVLGTLDASQRADMAKLKAASSGDFDATYGQLQRAGHAKALALLQGYAGNGGAAPFKAFAATTAPVVSGHITQAAALPQ